ncbi:energy-coupling factor transporter transmembrane component T family protein [Halovenus rubra]|uniref:Energy-coupling factor transporter transmembrane component T family protein n=2 Tax=Halovenus rubra TaxID=869890 RepID=A0ACC7E363_9EURY|nr:energy-coupling factor transporter transmembrane component T [Halovenus rubra]
MITYEYGTTLLHQLDPRSKLLVQFGFAFAAVTTTEPAALVTLTLLAIVALTLARLSVFRVLWTYRFVLLLLGLAPLFASLKFGSPWIALEQAPPSILAGYQVVLVLFISAAYVKTTPVRETRAAIQRHVPGKAGQLLGVGVGLVFRFFPVLLRDVRRARLALRARGGDVLSTRERVRRLSLLTIEQAFSRGERLALALRARCFSWNPTLPQLAFTAPDYLFVVIGLVLVGWGVLQV